MNNGDTAFEVTAVTALTWAADERRFSLTLEFLGNGTKGRKTAISCRLTAISYVENFVECSRPGRKR
jgi:hypothetical protein